MVFFARLSTILFLFSQLFGCATQALKSNASAEKRKIISIVYAQGKSGASGVIGGILMPIGTKKNVHFVTVDGAKIRAQKNSKNKEFWLEPGIHEIVIKCTIQIDASYYDGEESLKYTFIANKEYILDAFIPDKFSNVCRPRVLQM